MLFVEFEKLNIGYPNLSWLRSPSLLTLSPLLRAVWSLMSGGAGATSGRTCANFISSV